MTCSIKTYIGSPRLVSMCGPLHKGLQYRFNVLQTSAKEVKIYTIC